MDNFKVKNKTNDDHINGHKEKPSSTDKHLSIESLISGLAVRKKVSKLLFENNINDQVKRALDEIANGI